MLGTPGGRGRRFGYIAVLLVSLCISAAIAWTRVAVNANEGEKEAACVYGVELKRSDSLQHHRRYCWAFLLNKVGFPAREAHTHMKHFMFSDFCPPARPYTNHQISLLNNKRRTSKP